MYVVIYGCVSGGGGNILIISYIRRLLLPFFLTIGIISLLQFLLYDDVGHVTGPLWFLMSFFWCKILSEVLFQRRFYLLYGVLIGFVSWIISLFIEDNRIFLLQGLCAIPFFVIGFFLKNDKIPIWFNYICYFSWPTVLIYSHLDMRACEFGCWPLDIFGACGAICVMYKIIERRLLLNRITFFDKMIACCGKYSLAILCMHAIEWKSLLSLEECAFSGLYLYFIRFIITFVLVIIVVHTPGLKKIYS